MLTISKWFFKKLTKTKKNIILYMILFYSLDTFHASLPKNVHVDYHRSNFFQRLVFKLLKVQNIFRYRILQETL